MNQIKEPTAGPGQTQPWKKWWPPKDEVIKNMTEDELKAKPWYNWKPDSNEPNAKPWLEWVPRDAHISEDLHNVSSSMTEPSPKPAPNPQNPPSNTPASSNAEGG
ncbi:hypothetical protein QBC40DRAFT_315967 [Triangularia verruculosa]|uniref:Uncharacterized protein n=1 Tax=Triangularia verruculosa TaxID=2587418 RepID=A0AAN6X7F6_9PEZI|nr:hypothetical protein QBC40DRAFT_315967 [Triangularia verruculosa]